MTQLDLGDGFYYKQGYGIYRIDIEEKVARLVIAEEMLSAIIRWQDYRNEVEA